MPNPDPNSFIHLRLHTEFSIKDGLVTIAPLIARLREMQMPAVAITDVANLFGLIKFYSASIRAGIKPVCGCDVVVENDDGVRSNIVLLVQNDIGYLNLTNLISELYTREGGPSDPVLFQAALKGRTEGLIALSGALQGDIGKALLAAETELASTALAAWQRLFPGRFYIELQRVGKDEEEYYVTAAVKLALDRQCPVVATNDVRFLDQEDFEAHEVRVCINERRTLDDPRRPRNYSDQQYLKSKEQMLALFADIPEAIANSVEIARRCNLSITLDQPSLPNYPVPDGMKLEDYLASLSSAGLQKRLEKSHGERAADSEVSTPYLERLDRELKIINQMGFAGYFLIVMEFIQWAKNNGIPVGPGRGSGAGSIVAYALGITDLDPLKYDLLFERFLNPERVSMPDFDVDFCMEGRDRVIQHVAELYGSEAVSQIITFGTMAAKAVVRDVARVQRKPYALADKLSKLIPFEPGITLARAFEQEPQLGEFVDSDDDAEEIIDMAYKLEGLTRNVGKHAGGVVIAPTRLTDFTPLWRDESGHGLVTQFDKNDVETAGLVKFDFLGLRTLTIIDWAVKMINAKFGDDQAAVDINDLALNDPEVYRLLKRGETTAVFQLESRGMKDLIKRLLPETFEDIIALVALFRPGPLQSGMVDDFISRKHGKTQVTYPHPDLEPVLSTTYGVILYQEQVMQIAQVLANYSLGGADILRKAMGKKNPKEMARQRQIFTAGATQRGIDPKLAASIFDLMEKFAGYGFNKSHSAAYALVSYQTAWLKTHYPAYFMAAVLSADMQNTDKIVTLIDECRAMKLAVLPPDVNVGSYNFTVNDSNEIVYGLGAIKGLGEGPVERIRAARADGIFENLLDLCQRVDPHAVNKRSLEALIRAGALDRLVAGDPDHARAQLTTMLPVAIKAAEQSSRNQASGVDDLFGGIAPQEAEPERAQADPGFRPWSERQRLAAEKETLGLFLSGHPIDEHLLELSQIAHARLAQLRPQRGSQIAAGLLHGFRTMKSKTEGTIAFLTLDDRSGRFEVFLSTREYEKYRDLIQKDEILIVECTVSVDDYSGGVRGFARELMTLAQARKRFAWQLSLRLEAEKLAPDVGTVLEQILAPYRRPPARVADQEKRANGSAKTAPATDTPVASGCRVRLTLQRPKSKGCILCGEEWQVFPNEELIQRLRSEFGKDCVGLTYIKTNRLH